MSLALMAVAVAPDARSSLAAYGVDSASAMVLFQPAPFHPPPIPASYPGPRPINACFASTSSVMLLLTQHQRVVITLC